MHRQVRRLHRAPILMATILASLGLCASAKADITVGEVAPPDPAWECNLGPTDVIQDATPGGNAYEVPEAGVLTSWSTSATAGPNQMLAFKVFRPLGGGTYSVVAADGPRELTEKVLNTFPIDIAVEAGDVIGLNDANAPSAHNACTYWTESHDDVDSGSPGDAAAGSQLTFTAADTGWGSTVNLSANLAPMTLVVPPVVPPTVPTSGPPSGTVVGSGSPTAGTPTSSPGPHCVVPRLGAKKLKAAKKALKVADCRLGRVAKSKGATAKSGVVASQSPQTGKTLAAGTKVAVKLVPPAVGTSRLTKKG